MNIATICRTLKLDPKTVRRFIDATSPDELLGLRCPRPTSIDRYKRYLVGRVAEGCANGAKLWNEIRALGFTGSHRTVRRFLGTLGATTTKVEPPKEFSAREVRAWIMRRPDDLDPKDRDRLLAVCGRCPALATTMEIAREFAHMLRQRRGRYLAVWIQRVEASDIPELRSFAAGICKDWDAVKAWSRPVSPWPGVQERSRDT
jgi:transposase